LALRLATGNTLEHSPTLSKSFCLHRENKFSLFACQARKPYSHKAFPRFHAREIIGKNFAVSVIFRRRSARESKANDCQVVRTKSEAQAGNPSGKERTGKEWEEREGREGKDSMLQEPIAIPH
jgi:hypothetical protein